MALRKFVSGSTKTETEQKGRGADAAAALHGALDLPGGAILQFVN